MTQAEQTLIKNLINEVFEAETAAGITNATENRNGRLQAISTIKDAKKAYNNLLIALSNAQNFSKF